MVQVGRRRNHRCNAFKNTAFLLSCLTQKDVVEGWGGSEQAMGSVC